MSSRGKLLSGIAGPESTRTNFAGSMRAMRARRRVSLLESIKLASKTSIESDDPTAGEASFIATVVFGIWWWIVGVPTDDTEGGKRTS